MNLPTLYKKTSTGKIQMWDISVEPFKHRIYYGGGGDGIPFTYGQIITVYGLQNGKPQTAKELIKEGKNLGKANSTTALEQAELEAKSQWEQKKKKGYVESIDDAQAGTVDSLIEGGVNPMLAKTFEKDGHKMQFPAYIQPKLDGHRCIAIVKDGGCTLWSRTRKRITSMPHIVDALERLYPDVDITLDGELYNHAYKDRFEELTSKIRQTVPQPGYEVVQYWVYDVVVDAPFKDRVPVLSELETRSEANGTQNTIVSVMTESIGDRETLPWLLDEFIKLGYEGIMIRSANGHYVGKRTDSLQKVKKFDDAEFPIKGVVAGKGKMDDKALFVCEAENGETFQVKMKGALDDLKKYLVDHSTWEGKKLTVQFQGMTNGGVPRFPVGLRIREDV